MTITSPDGITADLITDLSKLKGLLVIAPGTTFAYRDGGAEPARISSELGVDYLVTGTVQRLQQDLRINVNLIDARSGRALWGERYVGDLNRCLPMQDRITIEVVAALEGGTRTGRAPAIGQPPNYKHRRLRCLSARLRGTR